MFLDYCVDEGFILKNPCKNQSISIPNDHIQHIKKRESEELQVFTETDLKSILSIEENTKIKYIALISYATGMRQGEVLGLSKSDFDEDTIHIRRSVVTSLVYAEDGSKTKKTYISDTKNTHSIRDIPYPVSLRKIIKQAII